MAFVNVNRFKEYVDRRISQLNALVPYDQTDVRSEKIQVFRESVKEIIAYNRAYRILVEKYGGPQHVADIYMGRLNKLIAFSGGAGFVQDLDFSYASTNQNLEEMASGFFNEILEEGDTYVQQVDYEKSLSRLVDSLEPVRGETGINMSTVAERDSFEPLKKGYYELYLPILSNLVEKGFKVSEI